LCSLRKVCRQARLFYRALGARYWDAIAPTPFAIAEIALGKRLSSALRPRTGADVVEGCSHQKHDGRHQEASVDFLGHVFLRVGVE
jgi:hypothetical protein